MKKVYQKPAMTVVQFQQKTMLLSASTEVQSFGNSNAGLNYRGSHAIFDDDEDAR